MISERNHGDYLTIPCNLYPPSFFFFPSLQPDSLPSELPGRPIYLPAAAKLLQSGPTLCDPIEGSPPGSAVPGILQAGTLEYPSSFIAWKIKVTFLGFLLDVVVN